MLLRPTSALRAAATFTRPSRGLPLATPHLRPSLLSSRQSSLSHPRRRTLSTTTYLLQTTPMAAPTDTAAAQTADSSGITPSTLKTTLESKLTTTYVAIEDMSGGCGQAFNAIIVSADFEKKTHLQRHRLVNNALKAEIAAIHAWTPRCLTPEQWEKEQGNDLKMT